MKTPKQIAQDRLERQPSGTTTLFLGTESVFNIPEEHAKTFEKAMISAVEHDRIQRPAVETEDQRSIVLGALYDKLVDVERYLSGSQTGEKPRPEEDCCDYHRARYQHSREVYLALKKQKKAVKAAIALFSKEIPA